MRDAYAHGSAVREWRQDRQLSAKCFVALVTMRAALSIIGYRRISGLIPQIGVDRTSAHHARHVARHIERIAPRIPGASCLTQALALQWLLARQGHASTIQIGVRKEELTGFQAHAWVVCKDRVILGHRDTPLSAFDLLTELGTS